MLQENISQTNDNFERYRERISNFSGEFEFGLFLFIAKKNILWITLFFVCALAGSFLYLRYTLPVYESSSIIQIQSSNQANKVLNVEKLEGESGLAEGVELLRSKVFLKRVLSKLPLEISYYAEGTFKNNELYSESPYLIKAKVKNNRIVGTKIYVDFSDNKTATLSYTIEHKTFTRQCAPGEWLILPEADLLLTIRNYADILKQQNVVKQNSYYFTINDNDVLVNEYFPRLDVKLLNEEAKTLLISFKDYKAQKAADIVSAMTEEYKSFDIERKGESSRSVLEFIDQQLDAVYDRLKVSENSIQDFKKQYGLDENTEFKSSNLTRLGNLEDQIIAIELQENVLEKVEKDINNSKNLDNYNLLAILSGSEYQGSISSNVQELHKLLIQREEMLYEVTPSSEAIKALDYQINIQKSLLKESIRSIRSNLAVKKQNLKIKTKNYEGLFEKAPGNEAEFGRLQRLFNINEKYYTLLLEKKTEYSISKAGFVSQNVVLEKATPSLVPVSPNRKVTFIVYLLGAFLLSLLMILFRYLSHDEINSLNEITKFTNASISILGIIPKCKQNIPVSQLLVDKSPKSIVAEAFRSVRTNLQFINNEPGSKIIALTSTISGEGKTFIAINLAGIIAFSGRKVVIIDLDMRKPKIHLGFNAENGKGMSTLLIDKNTIEETIQSSNLENLDFITAGPIPPNPAELIISRKMDEVLEKLKLMYDVIIIDNPPVGLVSDGISMIQKADYPIYIFRADYSKRNFIQNVDRLFNENNIKKLSVILNGVDIERKNYGYNYGYGYGYGYGFGYGYYEEDKKASSSK